MPGGSILAFNEIFQGSTPGVANVSYDNKHRFVIKKNWTQGVLTTGEKVTNYSSTGPPAHGVDDFSCFVNNINLPTYYWKNNTGGEYTDLEKGALLLVCMTSSALPDEAAANICCNLYYDYTVYFVCK